MRRFLVGAKAVDEAVASEHRVAHRPSAHDAVTQGSVVRDTGLYEWECGPTH